MEESGCLSKLTVAAFKVALLSLPGNKDFYDGDDYWSIAATRQCLFF